MTEVRRGTMHLPGVAVNGESSLPSLAEIRGEPQPMKARLDEDDGLFVGYGWVDGSFPYRQQDLYTRDLSSIELGTVVLENRHLAATFVPSLGGRLWSLVDKDAGQELTFSNPVLRLGNLAIRNAWFSGGVEWNFGMVGHHPFTCSPIFTALLAADDGTPVLRMYEFERIRCCTYQVDFFLPEESRFLMCRVRIVNPNTRTVPVYWWSNIAVPERKQGRVIVGADAAYTSNGGSIWKTPVPAGTDGRDITYPVKSPYAWDYFWKVNAGSRKYVCHLDENGYGLIQASTDRLRGRKLFVWGQGQGGANWQEYLSGNGSAGRYVEIQAGLAPTQYECLPMPPQTAWEWMEAYGAMRADPAKVHGEWKAARAHVERALEDMVPRASLDSLLHETRAGIALKPAREILQVGSGWGALESERRKAQGEPPLSGHLDFGTTAGDQEQWLALLRTGRLPEPGGSAVPASYIDQEEWTILLQRCAESGSSWYAWYHLGLIHFVKRAFDRSLAAFEKSVALNKTPWALYGLSRLHHVMNEPEAATRFALAALELAPGDLSLLKETLSLLLKTGAAAEVLEIAGRLTEEQKKVGRVSLACAWAHLRRGNLRGAEDILHAGGGLVVPDIREGENSVTDLWYEIERFKAEKAGVPFDPGSVRPPRVFDFRMTTPAPDRRSSEVKACTT